MRCLAERLLNSPQQDCYGSNVGTCSPVDIGCICKSEAITQISCCVLAKCDKADIDSECLESRPDDVASLIAYPQAQSPSPLLCARALASSSTPAPAAPRRARRLRRRRQLRPRSLRLRLHLLRLHLPRRLLRRPAALLLLPAVLLPPSSLPARVLGSVSPWSACSLPCRVATG
jgi:hypothetical protein